MAHIDEHPDLLFIYLLLLFLEGDLKPAGLSVDDTGYYNSGKQYDEYQRAADKPSSHIPRLGDVNCHYRLRGSPVSVSSGTGSINIIFTGIGYLIHLQ